MSYFKIRSYAKINSALNVVGKQNSLHRIESIVRFINLNDEILIKKIKSNHHKIKFIGKFSSNIKSNNTVAHLFRIIDKKKLLKNRYKIIIKKNIPQKAGLGGGSMNAASLINYFVKKYKINLSSKERYNLCSQIGSDVILGIDQKNLIISYKKKITKIKKNLKMFTLMVKPNFGCSTKSIFKRVRRYSKPQLLKIRSKNIDFNLMSKMKNDLEPISLKKYPRLQKLRDYFLNIDKNSYVRMTGSGSTIVGYFKSKKAALNAKKLLKKNYKNYWCNLSKTI
jgi:4-diphosphocytidyl-2-C-methyl-D-erythritol kinase